jgi:hypothetical protein
MAAGGGKPLDVAKVGLGERLPVWWAMAPRTSIGVVNATARRASAHRLTSPLGR